MSVIKHHNGLYTFNTDFDLQNLKQSALQVYDVDHPNREFLAENQFRYDFEEVTPVGQNCPCNFLMDPLPAVHSLYWGIHDIFQKCQIEEYGKVLNKQYYIQSWVNVYYNQRAFEWHSHTKKTPYAWHGYLCINGEPSKTSYRFFETKNEIDFYDVECKNNSITIGLSHYEHRTWPWYDDNDPRITVAFDIIPGDAILKRRSNQTLVDILKEVPILKNRFLPI